MLTPIFWIVPLAALVALAFALFFYKQMMKADEGSDKMKTIAGYVRVGAMSYLKQQYKVVGIVFLCLVVVFSIMAYGFDMQNPWVPVAFLSGGFFSAFSGYLGMKTATNASARTANAAISSLNKGLQIAFRSGAVMGLVVVGLVLIDISTWYLILNYFTDDFMDDPMHKLNIITTTMLTFGMGASTQALFARVGGGIYTKAADVGADLVGKVEASIPEDDPRNPAVIADNVGDNVGDCAGMAADLFETYAVTSIAAMILGSLVFAGSETLNMENVILFPLVLGAVSIIPSIIGIFCIRLGKKQNIMQALYKGLIASGVLAAIAFYPITKYFIADAAMAL